VANGRAEAVLLGYKCATVARYSQRIVPLTRVTFLPVAPARSLIRGTTLLNVSSMQHRLLVAHRSLQDNKHMYDAIMFSILGNRSRCKSFYYNVIMWTNTFSPGALFVVLAVTQAANPGDIVNVYNQSVCGPPNHHPEGCFSVNSVPITLCRRDNVTCSGTHQMLVTGLASHTDPVTGCHSYEWTWTCALDYRACIDGNVCVCSNSTTLVCDCNATNIYNGTERCTSAPTSAPTAPTSMRPTSAPTSAAPTSAAPTDTSALDESNDDGYIDWIIIGVVGAFVVLCIGGCAIMDFFRRKHNKNKRIVRPEFRSHTNAVYDQP